MSTYEVFDLLYDDFWKKIEDKKFVFTQKYTISSKRIHLLKEGKKADPSECLEFLNDLQKIFAHDSGFSRFHFPCYPTSLNIVIHEFLSQNKEEMRMLHQFWHLVIE